VAERRTERKTVSVKISAAPVSFAISGFSPLLTEWRDSRPTVDHESSSDLHPHRQG
jgi:hypothetical protein